MSRAILLQCNKCYRLSHLISRKKAIKELKKFNEMYNRLSIEKQLEYYGGEEYTIEVYERCSNCGNSYKNFTRPDAEWMITNRHTFTSNPIIRPEQ